MTLVDSFSDLPDPRKHQKKNRHKLIDVVVMTICATIGGADDWVSIVSFSKSKRKWFESFLELPGGIPSHDTFARLFALIDSEKFGECFMVWVRSVAKLSNGRVVPIDGKTLRGSGDRDPNSALHLVSAFCTENHMVLGQLATDEKSNEITAIPKLLDILDVTGAIVTIDAMGAQRDIVDKVASCGADYVIGLKANQPKLLDSVVAAFEGLTLDDDEPTEKIDVFVTDEEKEHGRKRLQGTFVINDLSEIHEAKEWTDLASIVMVITETLDSNNKFSTERRYYISSLGGDAERTAHVVRSHWQIENRLHWVLDVAFNEDSSRVHCDNGARNLAVARHMALNLLRQDKTAKMGIKNKRLKAGWDNDYLASLLFGE